VEDIELTPSQIDLVSSAHSEAYADYFTSCDRPVADKLNAFPRFVDRSYLSRFLVRYELFKKVLDVQGSAIECGVFDGGGTFALAQISSILEPLNHRRQIVGFDTFAGFPSVTAIDQHGLHAEAKVGGYSGSALGEIERGVDLFDRDRPLSHLPKLSFVAGDFLETGPRYLEENPHLVVSFLYLDFDLAEPTRLALELFLPRMPAGAVVAFDEVHVPEYPGETEALMGALNLRRLKLQRLPFTSICWAVLTGDEKL
jgi:hypothetical protein